MNSPLLESTSAIRFRENPPAPGAGTLRASGRILLTRPSAAPIQAMLWVERRGALQGVALVRPRSGANAAWHCRLVCETNDHGWEIRHPRDEARRQCCAHR